MIAARVDGDLMTVLVVVLIVAAVLAALYFARRL